MTKAILSEELWFDVGKERYTTQGRHHDRPRQLWFDVGKERYTTHLMNQICPWELWFDVGKERYTTERNLRWNSPGCGLM